MQLIINFNLIWYLWSLALTPAIFTCDSCSNNFLQEAFHNPIFIHKRTYFQLLEKQLSYRDLVAENETLQDNLL